MIKKTKTPQEKVALDVVRDLAPVVGYRWMQDGEDLLVFVSVRKPSRRLLAYRVSKDGEVSEPLSFYSGVNQGFKIVAHAGAYDAPRNSPEGVARGLPRFRDIPEVVRFLATFPMIPTGEPAFVHEVDSAGGKLEGFGSFIETKRYGGFDREGKAL